MSWQRYTAGALLLGSIALVGCSKEEQINPALERMVATQRPSPSESASGHEPRAAPLEWRTITSPEEAKSVLEEVMVGDRQDTFYLISADWCQPCQYLKRDLESHAANGREFIEVVLPDTEGIALFRWARERWGDASTGAFVRAWVPTVVYNNHAGERPVLVFNGYDPVTQALVARVPDEKGEENPLMTEYSLASLLR